jgi:23S rRNA (uracil1939-C5)-methyltransferase
MKPGTLTLPREVTITIESLASTGKGVGRITEDGFKRAVFVAYSVPGDVAVVKLTKKYKRYYEGEIAQLLTPSTERITPSCPHFGECGACDYLHISYAQQIKSKEELLAHSLQKFNVTHPPIKTVSATQQKNYRIKARVFADKGKIGFYKRGSNDVISITHCDIVNEQLNGVFARDDLVDGEYSIGYDAKEDQITTADHCHYTVADCDLVFDPSGFVQSNVSMNEQLVQLVLELVKGKTVLELYSGNGNFSVPLAKKDFQVTAVEGSRKSHALANINKTHNAVRVKTICSDVGEYVQQDKETYDTIILDPPRTGAAKILPKIIGKSDTIIYVSCNAQTLGKELTYLVTNDYKIESIHLLDLFPQTRHFETVVALSK